MTRRLILSFLSLIVFASLAWPRFKEEDQKYLDEQFGGAPGPVATPGDAHPSAASPSGVAAGRLVHTDQRR